VATLTLGHDERTDANVRLTPYVPRIVIDWLRNSPEADAQTVDGSLLFADISGFTKLSEALAKRGKVGAELMRDALNGVFIALLDDAYDYGASLIKWGGDAILLLFDEHDHEARACRAAWEMQKTLDRVGRLHAPGGTVVLRMSVGITSGPVHFYLVGSVHRELLIAGPTATEVVTMEAIADAGEVALSPGLAGRLPRECSGAGKDEAILLAAPPAAVRESAPDVGDVSTIDVSTCIPVAARAHVLEEHSEPEHRTITTAFIDLIGTDSLLVERGVEALAADFDVCLRAIQEAAFRHQVPFYESDVGKGSVKVLLTAGAPSSTGRDEERMLLALREIIEAPGRIPIRVGVNTGKVFAGDFGPPYRRAYRVFGDAINTAARVMSRADAGQILATEIVLERSRRMFVTTPIEPFAAKGKALPIHASIVGPEAGVKERVGHRDGFAKARAPELDELLEAVDAGRKGQGWTIELSGRSGLGKSHLIDELIRRSPDLKVHRSRCDPYQSETPYFGLHAVLRSTLGVSADASPAKVASALRRALERKLPHLVPWAPVTGIPFGLDLPATPETSRLEERFLRERIAETLTELLAATLANRPAILVIEDAHFSDEATVDLLARLESVSRGGGSRPWLLLVSRDDPSAIGDGSGELRLALDLQPLGVARCVEVIHAVTEEDPLSPHVVDEVARRSGGNLQFLFALLDHVRETRSLASLPDSIEALVAADIDRLAPRDRDLARYAAVVGTTFDPALVAAATQGELVVDNEAWSRLGDLIERDPAGGYRFKSGLIRDTAYEGLPYRRRRQLHAWLAEEIELRGGDRSDEDAALIALHAHEAQQWARAWRYARRAADRAIELYANVDAAVMLERAIEAGRRVRGLGREPLAVAYIALGDARFHLGEFDRAALGYRSARRLLGAGSPRAGELTLKEAQIPMRFGNYTQTLRRLSRGLHELEPRTGRTAAADRARLYSRYGAVRMRQNRSQEAIACFTLAEKEAKRGRAPDVLAYAYTVHDLALLAQGRPEEATHGPAALALFEQLGNLVWQAATLNNTGLVAYELGRWSESLALYARAGQIWKTTGDHWSATFATYNRGEILSDQGRFDQAESELRDALRVWRASSAAPEIAQATRQLGRLAARRGDDEAATNLLGSAREQQLSNGEASEVLWTDAWIAEAHVLAGDPAAALERVPGLRARSQKLDAGGRIIPLIQRLHGWAMLELGAIDEAAEAFELGLNETRGRSAGFEHLALLEGQVLVARARSAPDPAVEAEFEAKLDELDIAVRPAARLRTA
jgi:class 3 adenylate cyclase/tetratricopeptide (TPR) repeat protein